MNRLQGMSKSNVGYFVDPSDGSRFGDHELWDVHGQDLIGADRYGLWWGTPRAMWVLSDKGCHVVVYGRCGHLDYVGHFFGTVAEAVDYAECHCITVSDGHEVDEDDYLFAGGM